MSQEPESGQSCVCGDRSRAHINHRKTIPCWTYIGSVRHVVVNDTEHGFMIVKSPESGALDGKS